MVLLKASMLERRTFGGTPAAIYLADRLNEVNSKPLTRYVGSRLVFINQSINELVEAHYQGIISAPTLGRMLGMLRETTKQTYERIHARDPLTANLTNNVMIGQLKNWNRRLASLSIARRNLARELGPGARIPKLIAKPVPNEPTDDSLIAKSLAKLKRQGKTSTLY